MFLIIKEYLFLQKKGVPEKEIFLIMEHKGLSII